MASMYNYVHKYRFIIYMYYNVLYIFIYLYNMCVCVILFMVICRCFQRPGRVLVGAIPGVLAPDRSALLPHRVMNGEQL